MILRDEALFIKAGQGFDPTFDKITYKLTLLGYKEGIHNIKSIS